MGRIFVFAQNCGSAIPITFDFDPYNNQVQVELNNFGYNTYQLYDKAVEDESTANSNFDNYPNCTLTTSDQYSPKAQFMDIWDELPGNMMRFPGGTASQLYHSGFTNYGAFSVTPTQSSATDFYPNATDCPYASYTAGNTQLNTGNNLFKGYGVRSKTGIYSESLTTDVDFASNNTSSIFDNLYNKFDPFRKRNIIYDFIELIKEKEERQDGKPVEVLFVFNIMTHLFDHTINLANENQKNLIEEVIDNKIYTTPAHTQLRPEFVAEMNENLNTLRFLLENGITVVGVEMGNELTHDRYKELNLSPNEYIEIVKQYAAIIRIDPQLNFLKIGVVGEVSLQNPLPNLNSFSCDSSFNQQGSGILQMSTSYNLCWDFNLSNYSTFTINNNTYLLYDAFIIHKYFFSNYANIYNLNETKSLSYFMSRIEDLKTIYLSNTQNNINNFKIWFTEWNQDAGVINGVRKSENTRYIYDVYSYLTQYNALNNNLFEYTTFHNFLGAASISLLYTDNNGANITQRDNIKAHYLMNKLQDLIDENQVEWVTTSTKTSVTTVAKSGDLKFLNINVGNNKLWLRDYGYLSLINTNGISQRIAPGDYPPVCLTNILYKTVYFAFNNSTSNSYCLNPKFKNTSTQYAISPTQLFGNTLSPTVFVYTENSTSGNFNTAATFPNSGLIPPKSIGYVKYSYSFDPIDCYEGARIANIGIKEEITNNSISIYPNPTQNKLFMGGLNEEREYLAIIFDAQGKASNYKIINNEIDISNLSNGIYFLSLENEGTIFHQKFVIQK